MSVLDHLRVGTALLVAAAATGAVAASANAVPPSVAARDLPALSGRWHTDGVAFAPSAAAAPKRGIRYGGSTSSQDPMVILLSKSGTKVTTVSVSIEAKCTSGQRMDVLATIPTSLSVSKSGSFAGTGTSTGTPGPGLTAHAAMNVVGKVKGLKLTGTLKYHADITDAAGTAQQTCDQSATFKLASAPAKVFAGVTSQGGPVVIELTNSKDQVHHFHIGWQSRCTPSGFFQVGDTLQNFPIISGKFGAAFDANYSEPGGEQETNHYVLKGKLKGTKSSGSMQVQTKELDASGATVMSCDSGVVSFKASSD